MVEIDKTLLLNNFWQDVISQDTPKLQNYFLPDATVKWHNTNELFSVEEYVRANCEYPGEWCGEVERIELIGAHLGITVARVWLTNHSASFHAVSFFEFSGDKISSLEEYWGDDGTAPQWRLLQNLGQPLR